MKKILLPVLSLFIGATITASAATIKLPKEDSVYSVTVPDDWKPEDTDEGIACESEDQAATVLFEVVEADKLDALIDANIEWLKENKVVIDEKTKTENKFEAAGMTWSMVKYDGKNEEFGPATIMLVFGAKEGSGQVLMATYWVTKEGEKAHGKELTEIFDSVKPLE